MEPERWCKRGHAIWGDNESVRGGGGVTCYLCVLAGHRIRAAKRAGRSVDWDYAILLVLIERPHLEFVSDGVAPFVPLPTRCKRGHWMTGQNLRVQGGTGSTAGRRACDLCRRAGWLVGDYHTWSERVAAVQQMHPQLWRDARTHPLTGEITEEIHRLKRETT